MLNLVSLEFFLKIGEEILATAHPRNFTLPIKKTLTPVDQIGDSIFTVRTPPHACFKEIRSKQIRTIVKDFCLLEDIRIFSHFWHSAPLTWLLTAIVTYIPTLPMNKSSDNVWCVYPGIPNQVILIILLLTTLVFMIAFNVYYRHCNDRPRNSFNRYFYGTGEVQVMNFKLLLGSDVGARHWKWLAMDCSLLGTIFDTSVLIFTTFLTEII